MANDTPAQDQAKLSIMVFGVYAMLTGVVLIISPNTLLGMFGMPPASEIWIRVAGLLALIVGYYYWACGRAGAVAFFRATIPGRLAFCVGGAMLVALVGAPVQLLMFGAADLAGAAWTAWALRSAASRAT